MNTTIAAVAPTLIFGWGNPSRGDDALGPMFIEQARTVADSALSTDIEYLTDFQLQVEHALDLLGRERVLFIDASVGSTKPFEASCLCAAPDHNVTTHAMSPAAVMQVFEGLYGHAPPPCTLLAIQGIRFELGEPLSAAATNNLASALAWLPHWLAATTGELETMDAACTN
jgi:hydrogenase maturation protease